MLQLTSDNYYSMEANQCYMSYSQYKSFSLEYGGCEAKAMAQIFGGWSEPTSEAFLIGSYVHAWNEGTLDLFKLEHPELFSSQGATKGQLKATYEIGDAIIETLQNDEWCMEALSGEKERIVTAAFADCLWKCRIDVLNLQNERLVDLKTSRSLSEKVWNDTARVYEHWIVGYGYIGQMAAYCEIERRVSGRDKRLNPLIVAASKEEIPDKAILFFNDDELDYALEMIEFNMPHVLEVKTGKIPAVRCEKCRYCRETKKVSKILHWSEL